MSQNNQPILAQVQRRLAPVLGIAQLLLLVSVLGMATVMVLRLLFGLTLASVPRVEPQTVAYLAGIYWLTK